MTDEDPRIIQVEYTEEVEQSRNCRLLPAENASYYHINRDGEWCGLCGAFRYKIYRFWGPPGSEDYMQLCPECIIRMHDLLKQQP